MKAYMSNPDSGVRNLKPHLYEADRIWLERTSLDEARSIMAETEPESRCPEAVTARYGLDTLARSVRHPGIAFTLPHDIQAALADALRVFIES